MLLRDKAIGSFGRWLSQTILREGEAGVLTVLVARRFVS